MSIPFQAHEVACCSILSVDFHAHSKTSEGETICKISPEGQMMLGVPLCN